MGFYIFMRDFCKTQNEKTGNFAVRSRVLQSPKYPINQLVNRTGILTYQAKYRVFWGCCQPGIGQDFSSPFPFPIVGSSHFSAVLTAEKTNLNQHRLDFRNREYAKFSPTAGEIQVDT
jgi:hypothetical protein